ncbi:unnamed protein product [Larinioides sclopetarius]|uniref:Uncharacterized protein n=1 Tax=Larinioides sclopetarius TaxID=280406 RepID=A0AAV2BRC6_9ARAC
MEIDIYFSIRSFKKEQSRETENMVCVSVRITYATGATAAHDVAEMSRLFMTSGRYIIGVVVRANANCSLYTTNGMLSFIVMCVACHRHESRCVTGLT